MYIKLLGENECGFALDCTVGKVYEVEGVTEDGYWFYDDEGDRNYLYCGDAERDVGNWQVVNKEGNVL